MLENYSDKATNWAQGQQNDPSGNTSSGSKGKSGSNSKNKYNPVDLSNIYDASFSVGSLNTNNVVNTSNGANTNIGANTNNGANTPSVGSAASTSSTSGSSIFSTIFSTSTTVILIWFLVIYCIAYFLLGSVFNTPGQGSNPTNSLSQMLDIFFVGGLLLFIISYYFSSTPDQQANFFNNGYQSAIKYINTPTSIFNITIFIVSFYLIVYLLRIPMTSEGKPMAISLVENCSWILFVIIGINDFFKYILHIDLYSLFSSFQLWNTPNDTTKHVVDVSANTVPVTVNEVFNISNNLYTYDDAQAICTAYGAKVATYDQVEHAYNQGGEWCNYGWSDGQMILFPTQKATWQKLQDKPEHKNDCGRPGINGGYIANPYLKFGVNCYGKKPTATTDELNRMTAKQNQVYPLSDADKALQAKVDYWKQNASSLLQINSFNTKKWSEVSGN
uniref:Link domain-containing protein n=1 Tax=viral metagenome TaxID=1070528 RepID=A0A6C0D305_9ZZZZ